MTEPTPQEKQVVAAWERASQSLFSELDRIQERLSLDDQQMLDVVETSLGMDIADEYQEWLSESVDG